MDIDISFAWQVVTVLSVALALSLLVLYKLTKAYGRLKSEKRSGEVRRGFMTEQWLPLVEPYPWDPQNFRFLGSPIDGVQFEADEVVLVEFKSGNSRLSARQIQIRDLVDEGKVSFREVRVRLKNGEFEKIEVQ